MPFQRATLFFLDTVNNTGWTEGFYFNGSNLASSLVSASTLIAPRAALLEDTCQIVALRNTTLGPPRDSLFNTTSVPVNGTIAHVTYPAAGPWDALLIRKDFDGSYQNKVFMHGVPVGIFAGRFYQNGIAPGVAFQTSLNAYLTAITASGALVRKAPGGVVTYASCNVLNPIRRTEHRVGRPFDPLRGRRAVA